MNKSKNIIKLFFLILMLSSCSHFQMASKLNDIGPGMTKADVITYMGPPEYTYTGDGYEDLTYMLNANLDDFRMAEPYLIHFVGGKVEKFGPRRQMQEIK